MAEILTKGYGSLPTDNIKEQFFKRYSGTGGCGAIITHQNQPQSNCRNCGANSRKNNKCEYCGT